MSAQTRYGFTPSMGAAGGIADMAPYAIDTFINEEEGGVLKFGLGVVSGTTPGNTVALPATGATAATFEGVVVNNRTTEYDVEGKIHIRKNAAVGVMRYGRVFVRVATDVTPAYGEPVYLVISGDEAGCFTNDEGENAVAVKARFLSTLDAAANVAMIELFNQAQA